MGNVNIYVGNLSPEITQEELRREFVAFGEVMSVTIMNNDDISSGRSRGYGYVEMASKSESRVAIANLDGKEMAGCVVKVIEALPLSSNRDIRYTRVQRGKRVNGKTEQQKH